jgi:FMN-dependent oxidoreductase (nitrilotriacetate monooxygenase family)
MAMATTHLGFAVTANLSFESPYAFARRMSTLDHLTRGRIGWNIVTGYLDSAARAMGRDRQTVHDDRYDLADEFLGVVRRLWEESWEDGAVLQDRAGGRYADPALVHQVTHHGRHTRMSGVHLCAPSPQRTPVLYQAGASDRGRSFAAAHAECVFVNGTSKANVARIVADLRAQAALAGRPSGWPRIFVGVTVVTAPTAAEAQAKRAEYEAHASAEAAMVQAAGSMGIDFAAMGRDDPIPAGPSQAVASNLEAITIRSAGPPMTPRRLMQSMQLGGRQAPIVGGPADVADALQDWMAQADVDGFMLARTVTPECFEDFIELVVPELQHRGLYKRSYAEGTLREKLQQKATAAR